MHGGAEGSGAPIGNKNAYKHGRYSRHSIAQRREVRGLIRFLSNHPFDEDWSDEVEAPPLPLTLMQNWMEPPAERNSSRQGASTRRRRPERK